MATNPTLTVDKREEMEVEEIVPERYRDIITGEFAYDPVRLPVEQDPNQFLYNRKTLQAIWETERDARNPFTRKWFDIKSVIPQTELRKEMKHFVELHRFPSKTVIMDYSKIVDEGEMKRHLTRLQKYDTQRPITGNQWAKLWKKINLVRLFCEFHSQNIELFISLQGFTYLRELNSIISTENDAKEAALDVGREIVRAIDVILTALRTRGQNYIGMLGRDDEENSLVNLSLICIVRHVYDNNRGYVKIQSLVLRFFSTVFHAIDIRLSGGIIRAVLIDCPCALKILYEANPKDISSEDLNNGIAILAKQMMSQLDVSNRSYGIRLCNALTICISREKKRPTEMSGFTEGQLVEAEIQARHNCEALEKGIRLIRDLAMTECNLALSILPQSLHIVNELAHMFQRFTDTQNEDEDEDEDRVGNRKKFLICGKNCQTVDCVHYRVARDGLDINDAISKKVGTLLDVEILRKFIVERTEAQAGPSE